MSEKTVVRYLKMKQTNASLDVAEIMMMFILNYEFVDENPEIIEIKFRAITEILSHNEKLINTFFHIFIRVCQL